LIFNILKHEPKNDIFFDWENILNLKGDTGPYLQYSFLRAQRILEKSKFKTKKIEKLEKPKIEEKERELMIEILRFPEVIEECVNKISPHFLAIFALNLAKKFNIFYDSLPVLKTKEKKDFRLFLTFSFHSLLKQIFFLFSLSFPKKM
jgi:arginyl-tRNA synthetase